MENKPTLFQKIGAYLSASWIRFNAECSPNPGHPMPDILPPLAVEEPK